MMPNGTITRIKELSSVIASSTSSFDNYLSAQALPTPSFDPGTPPFLPLPPNVAEARQQILEATDELHALIAGPLGTLFTPYLSSMFESMPLSSIIWRTELSCDKADTAAFPSIIFLLVFMPSIDLRSRKALNLKLPTTKLLVLVGLASRTHDG